MVQTDTFHAISYLKFDLTDSNFTRTAGFDIQLCLKGL